MPCEYARDGKAALWINRAGPLFLQEVYCDGCGEPLGLFRITLPLPQLCERCSERKFKRRRKR